MDTRHPNWIRIAVGTAVEMPSALADDLQIGDEFHQSNTGNKYKLSVTGANVREWALFSNAGGILSGKYWVGPVGLAPYQTIQTAISAAVADLHGQANPAQVWVMPGTYPGSVSLQAGIHVSGTEGPIPQGVNITGQVTFDPTELGGVHLNNLAITPVAKAGITVSNVLAQVLQCTGCRILGENNPAVMLIQGAGGSSASFENCSLGKSGAALVNTGVLNCSATWGSGLTVTNCTILGNTTTERSVRIASATTATFRDVFMDGQYHALGAATNTLWNCRVIAVEQASYFLEGGTVINIFGGLIDFTTAVNALAIDQAGAGGTLMIERVAWSGNTRSINSSIAQTTVTPNANPFLTQTLAVGTVMTDFVDVTYCDTGAGGIVITLPLTKVGVNKTTMTFKHRSGAGALTINAAGGETIDGGAGIVVALGSNVTIIAERAATNWESIGV